MAAIFKIVASRVNNIDATQYGNVNVEPGQIWYDPDSGELRLYNGNAGGTVINSGGGGNSTALVNGTSNVIVYPSGVVAISVDGSANVAVFEGPQAQFDNVVSTGNVTATYFIGNGSQLTGLPETYSNAQVATYLSSGNDTLGIVTTGNISGSYFIGNGNLLTDINGANVSGQVSNALVAGTVYTNAQPNITSLGQLSSLAVTGNVSANYFIGNGSLLTGITASLPSQASNSGKYLYTNGVTPSWEYVPGVFGLVIDGGNAVSASTDFIIDGGGA